MPKSYENHLFNLYSGLGIGPKVAQFIKPDKHHPFVAKFEALIEGYSPYNKQLADPAIYRQVAHQLAHIHEVR